MFIKVFFDYRKNIARATNRPDLLEPTSLFFFTKKFTAICASSRILKHFRGSGLDLGSTGLRKLFSIESNNLARAGKISPAQLNSVNHVVGQSQATADRYYIPRSEGNMLYLIIILFPFIYFKSFCSCAVGMLRNTMHQHADNANAVMDLMSGGGSSAIQQRITVNMNSVRYASCIVFPLL